MTTKGNPEFEQYRNLQYFFNEIKWSKQSVSMYNQVSTKCELTQVIDNSYEWDWVTLWQKPKQKKRHQKVHFFEN